MLNASELRIGNLVFSDTEPSNPIVTILEILQGYANTSYKEYPAEIAKNSILYNRLHPIPLTPEILEKCGFVKDRNGWHMPETQFSLTEQFYPCWLDRMLWPQDISDFKRQSLQYLHQLQNLFHALTGEELKIQI